MIVVGLNGLKKGRVTKVGITLKWEKPAKMIQNPKTWGEYLRNRRLELKMSQPKVAEILGIAVPTVSEWEHDKKEIRPRQYPRIIKFLGHVPPLFRMETLGQRIHAYRIVHGLTMEGLGQILKVSPTAVFEWENGKCEPNEENRKRLERLLDPMMAEKS